MQLKFASGQRCGAYQCANRPISTSSAQFTLPFELSHATPCAYDFTASSGSQLSKFLCCACETSRYDVQHPGELLQVTSAPSVEGLLKSRTRCRRVTDEVHGTTLLNSYLQCQDTAHLKCVSHPQWLSQLEQSCIFKHSSWL